MSQSPYATPAPNTGARRRGRLWPWFAVGFLLAFFGLSVSLRHYAMLPSGEGVVAVPLWRFYVMEVSKLFRPSALGPGSSHSSALFVVVFQHALLSAVGGILLLSIGWAVRRFCGGALPKGADGY